MSESSSYTRPAPPHREAKTWDRVKRLIHMSGELQAGPLSTGDLARLYGVSQRSVQRDIEALRQLGHDIPPPDPLHRYVIRRRGAMLAPQALAAYAAIRLAYHHSPSHNRHYREAMRHISLELPERIRHVLHTSVIDNGAGQVGERELEKVAQAWVEGRVLAFDYQKPGGELERGNELCVYFLEIGRTNLAPYVIGLERRRRGQVRTFKLSRMRGLDVLRDTYEPDETFDPRAFLSDAWGVVGGSDPITVQVRFAPDAAYRLAEGGYPNASFHPEEGGTVLAEFRAGADHTGLPRELMPFLLGWGPRAEVLAPPHVREHWLSELREAVRRYGSDS